MGTGKSDFGRGRRSSRVQADSSKETADSRQKAERSKIILTNLRSVEGVRGLEEVY